MPLKYNSGKLYTMKYILCSLFILANFLNVCAATSIQDSNSYLQNNNKAHSIVTSSEVELGEHWLRAFRSHVSTSSNPLLLSYIEQLLENLVQHSNENIGELKLVIVNNSTLNAFAVPGGVIGIHTGIFNYAQNEAQLASILAHEIAHLSKRHIFRAQQAARQQALPMYVALLTSIILASAGQSEASMAAISATQAASAQSQLRFSRLHETEADIEGLKILEKAGYSPEEMAKMFELLRKTTGIASSSLPPEYLLTHPLPNTRITEIRQRTLNNKKPNTQKSITKTNNFSFQLMKSLVEAQSYETHAQAIKYFKRSLQANKKSALKTEILEFGLASAYLNAENAQQALPILEKLYKKRSNEVAYVYSLARALTKARKFQRSQSLLKQHLAKKPNEYSLNIALIENWNQQGEFTTAQQELFKLSNEQPNNPLVWFLLAEVSGKKQDKVQSHQARAEYLILRNQLDKASQQLQYALQDSSVSRGHRLSIKNRIEWIEQTKKRRKKLGF